MSLGRTKADWHDADDDPPSQPGVYIIYDGVWERRVRYDPHYRYGNKPCPWHSLRGYPPVFPLPLQWRENDEEWGQSKPSKKRPQ